MIPKPPQLYMTIRTLLALALVTAVGLSVLFGWGGLTLFSAFLETRFTDALPPQAANALAQLQAGQVPSPDGVAALAAANAEAYRAQERLENLGLAGLAAMAALVSVGVGFLLARRVSQPIETIAHAARQVALGDLTARVAPPAKAPRELTALARDFNAMAEALEGLDREVTGSSAAIAHELRTPLTVLRSRLQACKDGLFTFSDGEADLLINQVDVLSAIVTDLQTVSLASAGQLALDLQACDLDHVARQVITGMHSALTASGCVLDLDLAPTTAWADPRRVSQMLVALLNNAMGHAAQGRWIKVRTWREQDAACLAVEDRGPGFAPDDLARATARFWRADPGRGPSAGGSGLGLSVVAALAAAQKGRCDVANRAGGGATIQVSLPAFSSSADRAMR